MVLENGVHEPLSLEGQAYANKYYDFIRECSTDILQISRNTNWSVEIISAIKSYIFFSKHNLIMDFRPFYPSYAIAESWSRLSGEDADSIQPHDIILLQHSYSELLYLMGHPGSFWKEAHDYVTDRYDYQSASDEYYAKLLDRR